VQGPSPVSKLWRPPNGGASSPPARSRIPRRACAAVGPKFAVPLAVPIGVESQRLPRGRRRVHPRGARLPTRQGARQRRRGWSRGCGGRDPAIWREPQSKIFTSTRSCWTASLAGILPAP
jgi:hypothetical protein